MNTNLVEWRGPDRRPLATVQMLPVVAKEVRRRQVWLAALFAGIALLVLVMGLRAPKQYTSSTTLLVEETNIIEPLLKGRTVPTTVVDRAAIAREVAFSRKVMEDILRTGGWLESNPGPLEKARLVDAIVARTEITNPRQNLKLIEISYSDSDPQRAYRVTRRFADLIIQESLRTKERESRAAFRFIDSQVGEYQRRLTAAENALAEYRRKHPDVMLGDHEDAIRRISELRTEMARSMMDLADQRSQAGAWQSHLARESTIGVTQARSGQVRARLNELQAERDKLSGTVTDRHPDMVRVQKQISDLEGQLRRGGGRSTAAGSPATAALSPEYGSVRSRLAEAQGRSSASASRVAVGQNLIAQELARLQRVATLGSGLANVTRNYELNRDLYKDLLERRENARMSMNLDVQRGGLNFRIQEPAAVPLQSNGIGLTQYATGGLLLAVVIPLLLLFGWLRFDPRARTPDQIEQIAGLPVLASIPAIATAPHRSRSRQRTLVTAALVMAVPLAYALAMTFR